jgi:predicted AAA+ superfamily ATPase
VTTLLSRHVESRVLRALHDTRVVAITGARQTGKTTLARAIAGGLGQTTFLSFDDAITRTAAALDPEGVVSDRRGLLVIDEVQRVPEVLLAIKAAVDVDQAPGRFLLTGSTDLLSVRGLADTLAGRIELVDLHPFSQGEIEGRREGFVDAVLGGKVTGGMESGASKAEYVRRACRGGFPEVVRRQNDDRRHRWFDSYLRTVTDRETRSVAEVDRVRDLPRVVRLLAARQGSPLNVAALARDAALPERTLHRYVDLLEAVFLIDRLRSWGPNLTSREARQPKIHITDAGLAAHLRGANATRLSRPETSLGDEGPLLEGFVAEELRRQLSWSHERAELMHYRDRDGREVDLILESPDGRIAAIEVKSSGTVRERDFSALSFLRERLGDRLVSGVVLHTGPAGLTFGRGLAALPIAALWRYPE